MSEEISPVIIAAVDLIKRVNEGLDVEFVGEMKRTEPSEHYPIGQLGVSTKMTLLSLEEDVFLGYQHCEDMLNPLGHLLAEELVITIFRDKLKSLFGQVKEIVSEREIQKKKIDRLGSQGKRLKVSLTELLSKEEFINKCKTDPEFSEKWGLKIEERELSLEERIVIKNSKNIFISKGYIDDNGYLNDIGRLKLDKLIPTKLITITYNNETIESYE